MASWRVLDSGALPAQENMERDARLLAELLPDDAPLLRFYAWAKPSATYGHFIDPSQFFAEDTQLEIAKRPTGGGIIFHLSDFTFSVFIPASHPSYTSNTMDTYHFVNQRVLGAIKDFLGEQPALLATEPTAENPHCAYFCMAKPTRYDVILEGRKVGGGAQRRTRNGVLHQGSIALFPLEEAKLAPFLLPHVAIWESVERNSRSLLEKAGPSEEILFFNNNLKNCLISNFV